ncbi:2-dehydro-3-deoxyphosphogluconate aldolase / (4S)-4-hydroxy-2-oxoglutarate aldolase [Candidatus Phytoplasma luffae]|uniref:2-dehydro-3-deoxyphosphogluconate aldolase / (4S)-4-hydroxy-2-oxoglutarate aldolase n=1 Tax=Loofah witches'-broom phytoplasma TaxID=35773 RepID=A0A975FIW7_LOWBP|nr:bifunctional 4-hydroxy-2-oxoglutarate aldolase/2-dehydro-3-deoxy-phosphogluconate aldolase [Candidatus Phytoplasma luffae]QTX02695.1 2-dehydro-3-deoxyphosphogluconate aldolase / (4S)-4-hydroxy-2-oxoglutarate aldolase [Candidatus Phytoplasma luffae]
MENIQKHIKKLKLNPLSVIVRTKTYENAQKVLKNTLENGFLFAEITLTVPNAYQLIKENSEKYPDACIGAGTVLTLDEAKKSIEKGAQYLVSPVYNKEILKWSLENDILYIPGVMTVNEMYHATEQGAQIFKFYPATSLTPETLKLIKSPFPNFKILATGGINLYNMESYFDSGVLAVGITGVLGGASDIVDEKIISNLAMEYLKIMKKIIQKRR